jgi:hypothetical protein
MSFKGDKRKEKKVGAGRAPEGIEATPVSAEKTFVRKEKKRKGDEQHSLSASNAKARKKNFDPESPDFGLKS